jgi:hypothetical protein
MVPILPYLNALPLKSSYDCSLVNSICKCIPFPASPSHLMSILPYLLVIVPDSPSTVFIIIGWILIVYVLTPHLEIYFCLIRLSEATFRVLIVARLKFTRLLCKDCILSSICMFHHTSSAEALSLPIVR